MASGGLTPRPLSPPSGFNWVFLVELLVSGILTVFFLFYFNRLFATLISYGIRAYTWHRYQVYVDIQALQISLLAGRIFFKDIIYHGHNQTIRIHGGYITWQYWLRKVRDSELFTNPPKGPDDPSSHRSGQQNRDRSKSVGYEEKGGLDVPKSLPWRISVKVSGLEAFIYNRSPIYDGIVEGFLRKNQAKPDGPDYPAAPAAPANLADEKPKVTEHAPTSTGGLDPVRRQEPNANRGSDGSESVSGHSEEDQVRIPASSEPPAFLRIFPIRIECNKGAIVIGNEHTTSVITAQFEKASGDIDVAHAGPSDLYRQLFNFDVIHPMVHMRHNPDFKSLALVNAGRLKKDAKLCNLNEEHERRFFTILHKRWKRFFTLPSFLRRRLESDNSRAGSVADSTAGESFPLQPPFASQIRWQGLSRYLEENQDDEHNEWDNVEYGKVSLIADLPRLNMRLFWDVPGTVPDNIDAIPNSYSPAHTDINGSLPPKYGVDIEVHGGTLNYGPWADRQRVNLQSFFLPSSYLDATAADVLSPGQTRVLSRFNINIIIGKEITLRIPMRESSKDKKWKGRAETVAGQATDIGDREKGRMKTRRRRGKQREKSTTASNVRPFAWIDVKVAAESTIIYAMDMVAGAQGYNNQLHVDVRGTEVSSSVNHGLLWRSGPIGLECDLSNPLKWNALRTWRFNITWTDLDVFLLRDHLFLITDLVSDWGSGPPSDYHTFTPFRYLLNVDLHNLKLYLNTNDGNIVNNPSDYDDNKFLILRAQTLHAKLTIPLDQFRPIRNEIPFHVQGRNLGLDVCMPPRNTLHTFLHNKRVADLGSLVLNGSYNYFTGTSSNFTDRLHIDLQGSRIHFILYGFLVYHFLKIKDNYFGEDMHFKTLEEFQGLPRQSLAMDHVIGVKGDSPTKSNDLDVILLVSVDEIEVLLPSHIYSAEQGVKFDTPHASADLRFTNYYMDLMANSAPLSVSIGKSNLKDGPLIEAVTSTELFVDSLSIYGHRLFGLPPLEPTYVCNWDFDIGRVSGECSVEFISRLAAAGRSFAFTLDDDENAVQLSELPIIHDVTYLRLRTGIIHIWLDVGEQAVLLSTESISLSFDDLADETFSQRLKLLVPELTLSCADARPAWRHKGRGSSHQSVQTYGFFHTNLLVDMLARKSDFSHERQKQQEHLKAEDQRTHRTPFLISKENRSYEMHPYSSDDTHPPAMPFPTMPHPVTFSSVSSKDSFEFNSNKSINSSLSLRDQIHQWRHDRRFSTANSCQRSASSASLAESIRQAHNIHATRELDPNKSNSTKDQEEGDRRTSIPLSVAFSSDFAAPHFSLSHIVPDLSDVPQIPPAFHSKSGYVPDAQIVENAFQYSLNESFVHRSFLVNLDPGIRILCTPQALNMVAELLEKLQSKQPQDILDSYQDHVITKILDHQKLREGIGILNELHLNLPMANIRFIHGLRDYQSPIAKPDSEVGQFDFTLNSLRFVGRVRQNPKQIPEANKFALHTTFKSLGFSVKPKAADAFGYDSVVFNAEINDFLLWAVAGNKLNCGINFRQLEISTLSREITYLSALIQRLSLFADEIVKKFETTLESSEQRLPFLAYQLTALGGTIPDPPLLTTPSYALRAGKDHLRNHDSWKILSRFRQVFESLSIQDRGKLEQDCISNYNSLPDNAKERVLSLWAYWRTWDINNLTGSLAFKRLYGSPAADSITPSQAFPIQLDAKSALIRAVIDPGPKQSDFSMTLLSITVNSSPPPDPTGLMLLEHGIPPRSSIVQIGTRNISMGINWELHELVNTIIAIAKDSENEGAAPSKKSERPATAPKSPSSDSDATQHEFQFVFFNEELELSMDSINLRLCTGTERLKVSLVGSKAPVNKTMSLSSMIHADTAGFEIQSRARPILKSQFDCPNLTISKHTDATKSSFGDRWMVAGSTKAIKVQVIEDLLGLLEIADSVLNDEVAYIQRQISLPASKKTRPPVQDKLDIPNISLALIMDEYQAEFTILPSLAWTIAGGPGRISATPRFRPDKQLTVNFDLGVLTHKLRSKTDHSDQTIAALDIPPINGTLSILRNKDSTSIEVLSTIEMIILEASSLHALMIVVQRPELQQFFLTANEEIKILNAHLDDIFPKKAPKSETLHIQEESLPLLYEVKLTLAGLSVHASAPSHHPESAAANLYFKLSHIRVKGANRSKQGSMLSMPKLSVQFGHIGAEMMLERAKIIQKCGNIAFNVSVFCDVDERLGRDPRRNYRATSSGLEINVYAETASAVVDVMNHLQDKIKELDLSRERKYLKRLRAPRRRKTLPQISITEEPTQDMLASSGLFTSRYSLELLNIQVSWIVGSSIPAYPGYETEDLVFSFRRIGLATKHEDTARLMIEDMQLQMTPSSADKRQRSVNSALLPEVVFNVAYNSSAVDRKFALKAAGKSLEIRLESSFILPANVLERSITLAGKRVQAATASWMKTPTASGAQRKNPFGNKRLSSLQIDADFAGAVVQLQASKRSVTRPLDKAQAKETRVPQQGRYGQFVREDATASTSLRAPGVALKVEYKDDGQEPSLNGELKIDGSANTLYPTVVPLIMEITKSIQEVVKEKDRERATGSDEQHPETPVKAGQRLLEEENFITADPSAILGKTRLNLGIRICQQEFSLSCQPIARVAATASFDDIYITINSVKSRDHGHFFAISAAFEKFKTSVQHVYSRESTFSFNMDSVVLSLMNSRHVSGTSGISAILKINPTRTLVNARQLQDFLLFREIWVPPEIRNASRASNIQSEPQEYLVQRYQQVTTAAAFPWNATVAIAELSVELDLGQALGKPLLKITDLWASSKKSTDMEQNLCIGVRSVAIESAGRLNGSISLSDFKVRTSISWPSTTIKENLSPSIQASIGFQSLRAKFSFDYQAFLVADIASFDFVMYNVKEQHKTGQDRLVAILDGQKVHVFSTTTSAAQGLAMFQAFERLVQENQAAYAQSLREIERFLQRKSITESGDAPAPSQTLVTPKLDTDSELKAPITLHTDVVVSLHSVNIGIFPGTFTDNQVLSLEASNAQARFSVAFEDQKIHSQLGMTLGQLSVALASVAPNARAAPTLSDITVEDVVRAGLSARGGTILRVPKVIATMQTWQKLESTTISYIFKSSFEGKVDVGWNYSRISIIRNMWANHSRTLASRLGKPLPESAVKITTTAPESQADKSSSSDEKITAVVNVPQSRYEYEPLEPPIVVTPQLRDMGEATPPLEWIGLHRDKLPNVTHQIVIVTLLELAKEVEDAYGRILGGS